MSSKNRKQAAKAFDIYPTDPRLVRAGFEALCEHVGGRLTTMTTFLEPGAYKGPFCQMASVYLPDVCRIIGVEPHLPPGLERYRYELVEQDFLAWQPKTRFDLVATNPPFVKAEEFILHSRELLAKDGLMFYLMRVGILGTKRRRDFWRRVNLLHWWVIRPRPSFQYEGGNDSSEYGFFLMDGRQPKSGCSQKVTMGWVDWDAPDDSA